MAGRFDALLNLKKTTPPSLSPVSGEKSTGAEEKTANISASLLANQQTSKEVNQQTNKLANPQTGLPAKKQTSKEVNKHAGLSANQQTSKTLKKFGSYLAPESIKKLKLIAAERDVKDYEVLQEAVDMYLEAVKK
jgi:hypothetical protein